MSSAASGSSERCGACDDEEKEEQAQLRRDYIDSVKANLKSQLNTLYVLDEKTGKKTKIVDFERERAARAGKKKENR